MKRINWLFYDIGSCVLIVYTFSVLIVRFKIFPVFIDIYYHLAVMQGYNIAGGITTNAYWEFAPFGRPQLYPPLLHILMLLLLKLGGSLSFIARFTSYIMFPITLLTVWFVMRSVFDKRSAFFSVLVLAGASSFFWHMSVLSAAALAQVLGLLTFVSIKKDLKFATPVLMTLMLYSHIAIPYFYFTVFLIYGILRRERRKRIFVSLFVSAMLYLPWLLHTINYIGYIKPRNTNIQGFVGIPVTINLWLWVFGSGGIIISVLRRKKYFFPLVLLLVLLPMIRDYPVRFWEAHSVIPLSILSGLFLSRLVSVLHHRIVHKIIIACLCLILLITPELTFAKNSCYVTMVSSFETKALKNYNSLSVPTFVSVRKWPLFSVNQQSGRIFIRNPKILTEENIRFAKLLKEKLPAGASVYVSDGAFGDFLFAFSGIPVSSGMLKEVKPYKVPSQTDDSYLIIEGNVPSLIYPLNKTYKKYFSAYGKTVFKNINTVKKVRPEKPVVPVSACFILLVISVIIILYDYSRRRYK